MYGHHIQKITKFVLFALIAISNSGCEQVPDPSKPVGEFYYFRVMWMGNASSEATVGWSSDGVDEDEQWFYYDTVDHGQDVALYRNEVSVDRQVEAYKVDNNFVRLSDLEPNTKYYFVVANENDVSERYWFQTASDDEDDPISIISGGDSRNNHLPRTRANSLVAKLRPTAVMFNGDMTDLGTDKQWRRWLEDWQLTIATDGRITPIIPARGNHEIRNSVLHKLFDIPEDNYYTVNINNGLLRVLTLNSETSIIGDQYHWLKNELEENSDDYSWTIAQYHSPMRPHVGKKKERDRIYDYWAPLFYKHGVNIVSEADSHTLKTTWPLKPTLDGDSDEGFVRDDDDGIVFIGEGCWGAPLRSADDNKSWTRDSDSFNHFMWLFIDKDGIEIRTVLVDSADLVEALEATDSQFQIPTGLEIWNPSNGDVIYIDR